MNLSGSQENNTVTESEFYMWRSLFALVHVDRRVTDDEVRFMAEALEDVPFSNEQRAILEEDIKIPQNPIEMFRRISEHLDQAKFFNFAREIVWVDGDYGAEEQAVMLELEKIHMASANVDDLIGHVQLELEDDGMEVPAPKDETKKRSFGDIISAFTGRVRN